MTYLPAPYESSQEDDLPSALGAGLAVVTGGITAWMVGSWTYREFAVMVEREIRFAAISSDALLLLFGWALATVLLALGSLLLTFRRGRGALVLGALLSIGVTAFAQFRLGLGTPTIPVDQWPLYWGGIAVLVFALLPATGRWVKRTAPAAPPMIGTVTTGGRPF